MGKIDNAIKVKREEIGAQERMAEKQIEANADLADGDRQIAKNEIIVKERMNTQNNATQVTIAKMNNEQKDRSDKTQIDLVKEQGKIDILLAIIENVLSGKRAKKMAEVRDLEVDTAVKIQNDLKGGKYDDGNGDPGSYASRTAVPLDAPSVSGPSSSGRTIA